MRYSRMIMEVESPEEIGYEHLRYNLAESSMTDRRLGTLAQGMEDLVLCYGDHRGRPDLRAEIAGMSGGGITADEVLVSVGAAGALFTVATALLGAGDRLVVTRPNYASNLETPRAIGADIAILDLDIASGFRVDPAALTALITSGTRLVSVTTPHNPTGTVLPWKDLATIAEVCARAGAHLLVDETYRDLSANPLPLAATLGDHVISVSSLSKTYGVPGIRVGWIVCRDRAVMTTFLAAKEQIALAHSVVDEAIALAILRQRATLLPEIRAIAQRHQGIVEQWIAQEERLAWVRPEGGVVCFPCIQPELGIDPDAFHRRLNEQYRTWLGPGHWFEQDARFFRLGFGYPSTDDLPVALRNISLALDDVEKGL